MTTCNICKVFLNETVEEGVCGCPKFYEDKAHKIRIIWKSKPMMLSEFMRLQNS